MVLRAAMESKRRGGKAHQTQTVSVPKKPKRNEILQKKRDIDELVKAASSVVDHLLDFEAFRRYNRDGLSVRLDCGRGDRLSSPVKRCIQNLLKVNMEGPFGEEWSTEEKVKRREMVAPEARYIFIRNDSGESIDDKSPAVGGCGCGKEDIVGFVHFQFIVEEEVPVLYVYELQLEARVQGKGLGNLLMELVELIAKKNHMSAVMLTVQKANLLAMNFYTSKLRYKASVISPSRVDPLLGMSASYEILCKTFEPEAKRVLEGNDSSEKE